MSTTEIAVMNMSVNETIRRYPATVAVFNRYGVDACCGGSLPVAEAAAAEGIDPAALRDALMQAIEASA